jgi:peptide/nickel transport system permease protein
MRGYLVRRLRQLVPMLVLISMLVFLAIHLVPGGPESMYAKAGVDAATMAAIRARLGLDQPLPIQYLYWLGNLLRGDLGRSYSSGRPVLAEIVDRLGPTLLLMGSTFVVVFILSVLLGVYSAIRQYSWLDVILTTTSFAGAAMPVFWLSLLLILLDVAVVNPLTGRPFLPTGGMRTPGHEGTFPDVLRHMIMPMVALGVGWVSWYSRYVRAGMLDVIRADHIRALRASGLRENSIIFRHALRNAALPLVTVVALDLPYLFAGALYVEIVFAWPGMGYLFYRAVTLRDYPVVMAVILFVAVLVLVGNLLADLAYSWLDPRIRYAQ